MSQEIFKEASPLSAEPFNFSKSSLAGRDISQRFTDQEKSELSSCIQESWENLHQDRGYQEAKIISFRSEDFSWGKYPDGEAYALKQHGRLQTDNERNTHLYAAVNLEDGDDVLATQTILRKLKHPRTILGTAYFPYERGDRPEIHADGSQELLLLNTLIINIQHAGVKGLIHINPHSPAFPWFCLNAGIAPLSLSAIPGMINEAENQGFLDGTNIVTANSDDGAKSSRRFLTDYICSEDSINGLKTKENGKTIVTYSEEDLRKVKDKTVIFIEDLISTGDTMVSSILQLLNRGHAEKVIILATFPIFAGNALDKLGYDPRIQVITTDGKTPIADITKSNNITVVPIKDKLPKVLEFDKQGINFWSQEGKDKLEELGLCIFPW